MRTYYTGKLMDENLSVREYIDLCAYQFGAFIHLRDSSEAEKKANRIPTVSDYHIKELEVAKSKLKAFLDLSDIDAKIMFNEWKHSEIATHSERLKKEKEEHKKLKITRDKIEGTNFPANHSGLKDFCIEQIDSVIIYHDGEYDSNRISEIENTSFEKWKNKKIDELNKKIENATTNQISLDGYSLGELLSAAFSKLFKVK